MANKQFGDTLRYLRKLKGYTQQQVATILGLKNKSTLGSWEVGKSEPDGYTLLKLMNLYEVEDIYKAFGDINPKQSIVLDNINVSLTNHETKLVDAYRNNPSMQEAVDRLLNIQKEPDCDISNNCNIADDMCEVLKMADNIRLPIKQK